MRYIIYAILLVLVAVSKHLEYANLLIDADNNPNNMGEYVGAVFISPLLIPAIVYGIVKLFSKTKKISFFRCSNWVLGFSLLGSFSYFLTYSTPKDITFSGPQLTVTVPDHSWKLEVLGQREMLFSTDGRVVINAERHSKEQLGIHHLADIRSYTRSKLGDDRYDENVYQVYQCVAKHFQCGFQSLSTQLEGKQKKEIIYTYLLDKNSVIQINAIFSEEHFEEDYKVFKAILNSAVNSAQRE